MSVSVYIDGIIDVDKKKYDAMTQIYQCCKSVGIDPPEEVLEFFGYEEPGECHSEKHVDISYAVNGSVEYSDGAVIDLNRLDSGIKKIIVYME